MQLSEKNQKLIKDHKIDLNENGYLDLKKLQKLFLFQRFNDLGKAFRVFNVSHKEQKYLEIKTSQKEMYVVLFIVLASVLSLGIYGLCYNLGHPKILDLSLLYIVFMTLFMIGDKVQPNIKTFGKKTNITTGKEEYKMLEFKELILYFLEKRVSTFKVDFHKELFDNLSIYNLHKFERIFVNRKEISELYEKLEYTLKFRNNYTLVFPLLSILIIFIAVVLSESNPETLAFQDFIKLFIPGSVMGLIAMYFLVEKKYQKDRKDIEKELDRCGVEDVETFKFIYLEELHFILKANKLQDEYLSKKN